ncbi:MAG: hypothetical protein ABEK16_01790 [Candidatus Nanohalobium sp.]
MSNNLNRLRFTGSVDAMTPFERAEKKEASVESLSMYDSDETGLMIFDVRATGSSGFAFYWGSTEEEHGTGDVTRLGAEHLDDIDEYIETFSRLGTDYSQTKVTWASGGGYDRISSKILERTENSENTFEDYVEDLRSFENILEEQNPELTR